MAQGWDMTFGEPGLSEFIYSAVELPDSNVVFFGYTRLWGTVEYNYFLSKVDPSGNLQWYHNYGNIFRGDYALDFDTLANGQLYLAGVGYDNINFRRGHRTAIADSDGNLLSSTFSPFEAPMGNSSFVRRIKKDHNDEVWVIGKQLGPSLLFRKYGLQGELLWSHNNANLADSNGTAYKEDPILTSDEGLVFLLEVSDENNNQKYRLAKIREDDGVLWSTDFGDAHRVGSRGMVATPDDGFLILNERSYIIDTIAPNSYSTITKDYLTKFDAGGNISWIYALDSIGNSPEKLGAPFVFSDGRIFLASQSSSRYRTYEFSPQGILLEETVQFHDSFSVGPFAPLSIVTPEEDRLLAFRTYDDNLLFYYIDDNQNLLWATKTNIFGDEYYYGMRQTLDGSFLAYGAFGPEGEINSEALVLKLDSLGQINTHRLHGTVYFDVEENCSFDTADIAFPHWIVNISGTPEKYAVTDTAGIYNTTVDDDTLTISVEPISPYWEMCPDISPITFPAGTYSLNVDVPMQPSIYCPYLVVDLATTRLRACKSGSYYINYCNWGTAAEDSVWVEVSLDANIQVEGASIPWQSQMDNTFIFNLGEVGVMECGEVVIDYALPCDTTLIGQTLCSEVYINPDTLCMEPGPIYLGAIVEVTAECQGDSLYFHLRNTGAEPTIGDLHYVVIEDAVLYMAQPFDLEVDEILTLSFPANGSTYRIIAEQEPGVPGGSHIGLAIEGCGLNEDGNINLDFINQFPYNDYEPAMDMDCRNVVASFDPNEKLAFPTGYGPQHLLAPNEPLDYQIVFQNTGNDTAFTVVLRDTLSQFLDPSSVRPTNASHPYSFDFRNTAEGQAVLEFVFDDILLPDSTTNERASHGFVKFHIDQRPDLPIGTVIENRAGIYFDINAPVLTNTVWHTIGEQYIIVDLEEFSQHADAQILVAPNPVTNTAIIQLEGCAQTQGIFQLYDVNGKKLQQQFFQNGQIHFSRKTLVAGVYHFQVITDSGAMLGLGKLVIQ
ncbi:MAG: hypothetical protein DHS20C18_04670 [Saprospiraceae bacterium]|nr:MAG: hypothetical protein DHS20C18_04670 [Saprospiraceae bacterium]